jgi:hypothetical protein
MRSSVLSPRIVGEIPAPYLCGESQTHHTSQASPIYAGARLRAGVLARLASPLGVTTDLTARR